MSDSNPMGLGPAREATLDPSKPAGGPMPAESFSDAAMSWQEAVDLLHHEARLLDDWRLLEWTELFTDTAEYRVPSTDDPTGDPRESLFLIYDDRARIQQRALRLTKRTAHAEYPHSRTTRILSNICVAADEDGCSRIDSNFVVYRARGITLDVYPGRAIYKVKKQFDLWKIQEKTAILGIDVLYPQSKLSIII